MRRAPLSVVLLTIALALAGCGGGGPQATPTPFGDAEAGREAYLTTCVTCHGADAKGIPGLGKDLTASEFLRAQTDEQVLAFLQTGRRAPTRSTPPVSICPLEGAIRPSPTTI